MWQIACLENTLKITKKCAKDLLKVMDDPGESEDSLVDSDGLIVFNPDHMESQDFLWQKDVLKILKKHRVNGKVLWGSLAGDNFGDFWGYEFKDGNMVKLTGTLSWKVST